MIEIGRICVKTAGRDSNRYCIVIDKIDDNFVIIEGETRRRKCGIKHLEPTKKKVDIKKDASKEECIAEITKAGFEIKKMPKIQKVKAEKKAVVKAKKEEPKAKEAVKKTEEPKEEAPKVEKPKAEKKPKKAKEK